MRLRTRMEREGWDTLRPHEMVELVLYRVVPRRDISEVSRMLVGHFGTVGGVFGASREELLAVEGVTARMAEWICLTGELMRAYCDAHLQCDICLGRYQEVVAFLRSRKDQTHGAGMWILYADFSFNLITYDDKWKSQTWWDPSNARRMVVNAVSYGARYVYMVLWEKSSPNDMSEEEVARLESVAITLRAVEVDLVDCLLARDEAYYSMNINGKMKVIRVNSGCMELHERYADAKKAPL